MLQIEAAGAPDDLFQTSALADALGGSSQWLETGRMASHPYGPPFERMGTLVFYRRSAVVAWLRERATVYATRHKIAPEAQRQSFTIIRRAVR